MTENRKEELLVPLPKATSNAWIYFGFRANAEGEIIDRNKVVCRLCGTEIKFAHNTTNLISHVRNKHKIEHDNLAGNLATPSAPKTNKPKISSVKRSVITTETVQQEFAALRQKQSQNITDALADFLINDLHPVDIIETPSFKKILSIAAPQYEIPSREYFVENLVPETYAQVRENIVKPILTTGDNLSLTTEVWKSFHNHVYVSVSVHFIDANFVKRYFVLDTREIPNVNTSADIIAELQIVFSEWNIDIDTGRISAAVTDNNSKITTALKEMSILNIACFATSLQTSIQHAFDIFHVQKILLKSSKLVGYFIHSSAALSLLLEKQQQMQMEVEKLKPDIPSHWKSTYDMLVRLRNQRTLVTSAILSSKSHLDRELLLSDDDWTAVDDIISVLEPFVVVSEVLCSEDFPAASFVAPTISKLLEKSLAVKEGDSTTTRDMKVAIQYNLQSQYTDENVRKTLSLASALDPRFKALPFLSNSEREQVFTDLDAALIQLLEQTHQNDNSFLETEASATKRFRSGAMLEDFLGDMFGSSDKQIFSPNEVASTEIRNYRGEKSLGLQSSPLEWWKQNKNVYPNLARFARLYLSIPATSISSDRMFTKKGYQMTILRNSLPPKNVERIIFLHANHK